MTQKEELTVGPQLLKNYAMKTLRRLIKFSSSRQVKGIISRDKKNAEKKLNLYIQMAEVSLAQLPDIQIICSSQQYCVMVDNTGPINQHIQALLLLRNQVTHTLNRATRLAYPTFAEAKKATAKFGKQVRKYGKELVAKAQELPKVRYSCDG